MLPCLACRLPDPISSRLFGNRKRWGVRPNSNDPHWKRWEEAMEEFYSSTQHTGLGALVNEAGYRMLRHVPLDGADILEIGPGGLHHLSYWNGRPARYRLVDRRESMLNLALTKLREAGIPTETYLVDGYSSVLPLDDNSIDVVVSYYALEHLHPLEDYIAEYRRVLRPGGVLVGGIPTEGGLAWGLGRALTTARIARRKYGIDLERIICWEHPNFADKVIGTLDRQFRRQKLFFWPLTVPSPDLNLVICFVYEKHTS